MLEMSASPWHFYLKPMAYLLKNLFFKAGPTNIQVNYGYSVQLVTNWLPTLHQQASPRKYLYVIKNIYIYNKKITYDTGHLCKETARSKTPVLELETNLLKLITHHLGNLFKHFLSKFHNLKNCCIIFLTGIFFVFHDIYQNYDIVWNFLPLYYVILL